MFGQNQGLCCRLPLAICGVCLWRNSMSLADPSRRARTEVRSSKDVFRFPERAQPVSLQRSEGGGWASLLPQL